MIPKRAKKKDQTTKRLGKLLKTLHLVGCGLRTVFCFKTFLPNEGRTSANGRRRGWQTNKQKKHNSSRAPTTNTQKTGDETSNSCHVDVRACLLRFACARARGSVDSWSRRGAQTWNTKSKGENTWEKTEYKPFFDSGNHIFFQKMNDFLPFW